MDVPSVAEPGCAANVGVALGLPHSLVDLVSPYSQLETIWAEEEARTSQKSRTNTDFPNSLPPGARTVICALLAFGAMFERRIEDGERLYLAARRCYMDVLELLSYESVQLAMQMAVFEINSNRSRNLWSTLAVATRTAHALVRHRSDFSPGVADIHTEPSPQASFDRKDARGTPASDSAMVVHTSA